MILILALAAWGLVEAAGRAEKRPMPPPPDDTAHCGVAIVRFTAELREAKLPPAAAADRTASLKAHAEFEARSRYLARASRCSEAACARGDVASCRMLRRITTEFARGTVPPKVMQRIDAADLDERFKRVAERTYGRLEHDCGRGDVDACFSRGASSLEYAHAVGDDRRRRRELDQASRWFRKACAKDHVESCLRLQEIATQTSDAVEAAQFQQDACRAAQRQNLPAPDGCPETAKVH
jgi:TPR repeat protein